jgi:hypothetical protein
MISTPGARLLSPSAAVLGVYLILLTRPVIPNDILQMKSGLTSKLAEAENPEELGAVYDKAFADIRNADLVQFILGPSDQVALQAAWQRVRRTMSRRIPGTEQAVPVDPHAVQRFLGVVEGRLRVELPNKWADVFGRISYRDSRTVSFPGVLPEDLIRSRIDVFTSKEITIEPAGDGFFISLRGQRFPVSQKVLQECRAEYGASDHLEAMIVDADRAVITMHRAGIQRYPLVLVNRKTGDKIWRSAVWVERPVVPGRTGLGHMHHVEITVQNDAVVVFGLCDFSAYIEAFHFRDGSNAFRFSTSY